MPADDATLLHRYAAERAQDAFAELVRRHVDGVYSSALRRVGGDAHLAEDVTQQVFAALARKAALLSHHPVLTGWLYLTTRNEAANVVRTEQRRKAREQEAQLMHETSRDSVSPADWSRVGPLLDAAIDELGENDRTAVLLRFVDRRGFAEIGATMRLSEDAARMRVDRALEKLRVVLARRGVASTSAALGVVLANHAVAAAPIGLGTTVAAAAIAAAPLVATPLAGILQFMGTSKIVSGGAAVALALTVPTAVYELHTARLAQSTADTAHRQNEMLAAQLRRLKEGADADFRRLAAIQKNRDEAAASAAADAALRDDAERKMQQSLAKQRLASQNAAKAAQAASLAAGDAFMARHPEAQQANLESKRASAAGTFLPLFKTLRLTPAQIESFKDLQVRQGGTGAIAGPNGDLTTFAVGNATDARGQMQALLGEDGYREYQEFTERRASVPWQSTVQIAGSLFDTPTPLTATQAEQLLRVLTDNRSAPSWTKDLRYDWSAIIPKTEALLAAPQLEILQRYQAEDELDQATARARAAWSRGGGGRAAGANPSGK